VYRATQLSLGRQVALKLIRPAQAADERFRFHFQREARLAASLDHPHALPVYEAGEVDRLLVLATRFVEEGRVPNVLRELPARG
jgi:serine/threonine protein kinase